MTDKSERMWTSACGKQIVQDGMKKWPSDVEWVRADHALALVAEALEEAAERMDAGFSYNAGNRVRSLTPSDALAAREARDKRVRDEALREFIETLGRYPSGVHIGELVEELRTRFDLIEGDQTDE